VDQWKDQDLLCRSLEGRQKRSYLVLAKSGKKKKEQDGSLVDGGRSELDRRGGDSQRKKNYKK